MEALKNKRVAVIGGINMDVGGSPFGKLVMRDSNPGRVTARPGGVGRNIAHDLCLLGLDVALVTAVGQDMYGEELTESCRALGMDMSLTRVLPDKSTSTYLYITDEKGDMEAAIADMEIAGCITADYLAAHINSLNAFDAVVLDANLDTETIEYAAHNITAPIYADAVSTAKAARFLPALGCLSAFKPNVYEAECLTGEKDPERAARAFIAAGVKRVFVSLGSDGILAAEGERVIRQPCEHVKVVNTTGAGDSVTAAIVWAGLRGMSLENAARAAVRAGAITAAYPGANSPLLSSERLINPVFSLNAEQV